MQVLLLLVLLQLTLRFALQTAKGDVLRVGEFDRHNNTAWQVDMLLDKDTLWVHPKIHNPNSHEVTPGCSHCSCCGCLC